MQWNLILQMIATISTALMLFVSTNIDDLLLLVALQSDHRRCYPPLTVLLGQIIGFGTILAISMLGFLSGLMIPEGWLACLGVLPLVLGLRQGGALLNPQRPKRTVTSDPLDGVAGPLLVVATRQHTILRVASLTLANGSDNIAVYLPLFGRLSAAELLLTIATFLVALGGLWFLAQWLVYHRRWRLRLQAAGPRLAPLVLIGLGLWLLSDSVLWTKLTSFSP
jgi:cadmium resistance protein CadD (predicted permease)